MCNLLVSLTALLAVASFSAAYSVPSARIIQLPIAKELPEFPSLDDGASERITGGEYVNPTDIPYAAGILVQGPVGSRFSGGSLVSLNYVLTAASSLVIGPFPITVMLGASNMTDIGDVIPATEMVIHIDFDRESGENDIALLRLARPTVVGDTIRPVRLPNWRQLQSPFVNQLATVSGWGALFQNAPEILPLYELRRVNLPVISNLNCALRFPGWITENKICGATDMGSPCQGDQGGPLTVADPDGRSTQIGIFSYVSFLGCNSGWPAVFTRITPYLFWIQENSDVVILNDFEY